MSQLPRYWSVVHAEDVRSGRVPKPAPSALPEFFAFIFAFVIAGAVIWHLVAFEQLPLNVWLQNLAAIFLLSAAGVYFRRRRQRLALAEKTFYAGKITANG